MTEEERYTLGYGESAMDWMTSRTVDHHGAFLLRYLQPGMSFLDCGCGPGNLTLGFAQKVAPGETIGIDQEASQFAPAEATARRDSIDNVNFRTGDLYALPFADDSFDVVFASAVLGSVARPADIVGEMTRVLKPGGWLALKEFDHGGDIIWPQTPVIAQSIELYHRVRAYNGHEPYGGRRLKDFIHAGGCTLDFVNALYFQTTSTEELLAHIERNNRLFFEILGPQYEALGWCSHDDVKEHAKAWTEFAQNPAAVYISTWFEAVGRKPE
jgi:ubiquinone/menaquinone biosynthesis C-methylase UbiE